MSPPLVLELKNTTTNTQTVDITAAPSKTVNRNLRSRLYRSQEPTTTHVGKIIFSETKSSQKPDALMPSK